MSVTHQMVTYCLNSDGTIPDFVYHGNDGIGGVYGVPDELHGSPQDFVMFCLTEYPVPDPRPDTIHQVFETKDEMAAYLHSVLDGATEPDFNNPDPDAPPIPVDVDAQIEWVWSTYLRVNGL